MDKVVEVRTPLNNFNFNSKNPSNCSYKYLLHRKSVSRRKPPNELLSNQFADQTKIFRIFGIKEMKSRLLILSYICVLQYI